MTQQKRAEWQPVGGLMNTNAAFETDPVRHVAAFTGRRNDLPEFRPYVWNPGEREREAAINAHLEAIRAHISAEMEREE
jgi:hypothetical protein